MNWAYAVTTCEARLKTLLPKTLASLADAGFPTPHLFIDGADRAALPPDLRSLPATCRTPAARTFGNWVLGLAELYIKTPAADRYAVFQDDFVTYRNLRSYLSRCPFPPKGYWNLYTFPSNQGLAPRDAARANAGVGGWYPSNQLGRGAVALVFDREGVKTLLGSRHMIDRPESVTRGHRAVDGGIVESMRKAGWTEYVHDPSLVQHTGAVSSMGNRPHLLATSFRGEGYDATEMTPLTHYEVK